MFLHRLAAGLVFLAGLGLLRISVQFESWPLLTAGLVAAATGIGWFAFAGPGRAARAPPTGAFTR